MSVWHMQPDIAASRRQHKQLYQVQGRYLRYVGLVALACLLYAVNPRHQLQPGTDTWMGQFVFHVGDWLLAAAAVLTLWSGFQYLHAAWPALRADEQAAAGRTQKNRGVNG